MIRHATFAFALTCCALPATAAPVAPAERQASRPDGPTLEEMVADFTRWKTR